MGATLADVFVHMSPDMLDAGAAREGLCRVRNVRLL